MKNFKPVLREIDEALDLPQPTKSRILIEVAADLNDAFTMYKNQGLSDKEATLKAKNTFILDKKSLQDLVAIHQTPFRKWFDQLSERGQNMLERLVFILTMIIILITGIYTMLESRVFLESGSFIWAIFILLLCSSTIFILKIYQIYIKKDHTLKKIKQGVSSLLLLSGSSLFLCVLGYYWELFKFKEYGHILESKMIYLLVSTDPTFPQVFKDMFNWMISSSVFIMVSMLIAIIIAFMWFIIMSKISKIEAAEADVLLAE